MTFKCATNVTGYSLVIFTRGVPPSSQTSVSLPNGGMMLSFNLTAANESNGTDVICQAFSNDGNATETAYLYVQGNCQYYGSVHYYYTHSQVLLIV